MGFTIGCPGCKAISRGEKESQNHTEECRARIEKALIEEGGLKGKRMTEGRERYGEHKAKKSRGASTTGDSGLRPGGAHTFAGPCNPSGNAAASSSGMNRQGEKRRGLDVQPNAQPEEEHSRKYQRQDDEEETENQAETQDQQEGDTSMDVATGEEEFQPDKEDSDCMFVEHWSNRKPWMCQAQGGNTGY